MPAIDPDAQTVRQQRQLAIQLDDVHSRLLEDLVAAGIPADRVTADFEVATRRFADAPVTSFVPILVERILRARWAQQGAVNA